MLQSLETANESPLVRAAQAHVQAAAATKALADKAPNIKQINQAAKQFEASFASEMLKPMFAGVNKPDPMFGGGKGEEIFNGMMVDQYGKLIADRGGLGIAGQIKSELLKLQEAKTHGNG